MEITYFYVIVHEFCINELADFHGNTTLLGTCNGAMSFKPAAWAVDSSRYACTSRTQRWWGFEYSLSGVSTPSTSEILRSIGPLVFHPTNRDLLAYAYKHHNVNYTNGEGPLRILNISTGTYNNCCSGNRFTWSHDGAKLIYSAERLDDSQDHDLWSASVNLNNDGTITIGTKVNITNTSNESERDLFLQGNDSDFVYFTTYYNNNQLFGRIKDDGSGYTRYGYGSSVGDAAVSPSGNYVAYGVWVQGGSTLNILNTTTGNINTIYTHPTAGSITHISWSD